jgi:hypothetical protein
MTAKIIDMAEKRRLKQIMAKGLSGKEIARLTLQNYLEDLEDKKPTFSETEIERAKASLRGRPQDAAVYNAWIEASRIVDYTTMEAIIKALEAEKSLAFVISGIAHLLDDGFMRIARQSATKILTLEEWKKFPAAREKARRKQLAEQKMAFCSVTRYRAWEMAPEDMKEKAKARPEFEEDKNEYGCLLATDKDATLKLYEAAEAEIVALVEARKIRFFRNGKDISSQIRTDWHKNLSDEEAEAFEAEAACTLLELTEAGLPEWVEWSKAKRFIPLEFKGPIAVLQEAPPETLDKKGRFTDPGWKLLQEQRERKASPEYLEGIQSQVRRSERYIRAFLARKAVIEVFSQEIGLDLFVTPIRERETALGNIIATYNKLAEMSREGDPDEDGFEPPEEWLRLPKDLRMPGLDPEVLRPDPEDIDHMRERLATPLGEEWIEAAQELAVFGTLKGEDPDFLERLRQRAKECGSIRQALSELSMGEVRG